MFKEPDRSRSDPVDLGYADKRPSRDLMNYALMDIEMRRGADTGTGWLSVLAVVGLGVLCGAIVMTITLLSVAH